MQDMNKLTYSEKRELVKQRQIERWMDAETTDANIWLPTLLAFAFMMICWMLSR